MLKMINVEGYVAYTFVCTVIILMAYLAYSTEEEEDYIKY